MIYQEISEILLQQNADIEAAEAHGIAVGMLSVEARADAGNWLQEILPDLTFSSDSEAALLDLFEQTRQALNADLETFEFELLLPGDDEPLFEQVEALRLWCQGFLFGIGYTQSSVDWPGEVGEVMRDIIELTKIDSATEDEDDANALMEICEYLRAAVFTVRDYFLETATTESH
jgi:yecA family protein